MNKIKNHKWSKISKEIKQTYQDRMDKESKENMVLGLTKLILISFGTAMFLFASINHSYIEMLIGMFLFIFAGILTK